MHSSCDTLTSIVFWKMDRRVCASSEFFNFLRSILTLECRLSCFLLAISIRVSYFARKALIYLKSKF